MPQGEHLFLHPGNTGEQNKGKTHCKRGHEFTPENTYEQAGGGRGCRKCKRTWYRRKHHIPSDEAKADEAMEDALR